MGRAEGAFGAAETVQGSTEQGWMAEWGPMSAARTAPAARPIRPAGFEVASTFPTGKERDRLDPRAQPGR